MSPVAPRPLLDSSIIAQNISRYWRVSVVEVTGSTQEDLLRKGHNVQDGEVLLTEFQNTGKGRLDRTFEAEPSSALMFSFYVTPQVEKSEWSLIPLITGVAAAIAISELNPQLEITLKWPNDLLVAEKKLGGIIAEATSHGIVIGIGINVEMALEQLPVAHATSLAIEGAKELNRNRLAAAFLNIFEDLMKRWERGENLLHLYSDKCSTLGREVEIELPGGNRIKERAIDISRSGELILSSGARITSGDVIHLR